ncbi:hypothetical protein [Pseudoruegeria sp. HB172150]|uniref:hypothetical protein n=1 Tax=Pseudoruegeria sp. HB172150 TaxID=2721164 RepID=UPI001551B74D|nr:hypothetical protein [Pseudoruegeria sp. HB172150]
MKALLTMVLIAVALPAVAEPSSQLVTLVENKMRKYDVQADVSRYDSATVARLYSILQADDDYYQVNLQLRTQIEKAEAALATGTEIKQ